MNRHEQEKLLFELGLLYDNSKVTINFIMKHVKEYINIYYKGDIDSFIKDLEVGDKWIIMPSLIEDIRDGVYDER
jgi:hypothetical protein